MSGRTKPRRHRPRPIAANPIALALHRASRIPPAEIAEVMAPIAASFTALRQGVGSEDQWSVLAGSVELALSIEHKGVVKGLQGHMKQAEAALQAICQRAMHGGTWSRTALYWQEIEALDTFVWLHHEQLKTLSGGEWRQAHDHAMANVRTDGGRVLDINQLRWAQQLDLISTSA